MSLDQYESIACANLGLRHAGVEQTDIMVGSFRICDHPQTFNDLAELRRFNAEKLLFNTPDLTEGLSEGECYELAYCHIPHTLTQFLEFVAQMPALERDHIAAKSDFDAYEAAKAEIEAMMEQQRPGILRDKGKHTYNVLLGRAAKDYQAQTGRNMHIIAERAKRHKDKMQEKYSQGDMLFFEDHWRGNRFSADVNGYLQYLTHFYPKYAEMLQSQVTMLLPSEAREKHTYIVGATGSGKSELIKQMAIGDLLNMERAVCVIDPHGDLVLEASKYRIFSRDYFANRLIYIDPFLQEGLTPIFNPLDCGESSEQEREVIADQLVCAFEEMLKGDGGASLSLNMRTLLKPCLLVLLDQPDTTLVDLRIFLNDEQNQYWRELGLQSSRPAVRDFFEAEFSNSSFAQTKESLRNKLQSLFNSSAFYNIVNGSRSTFDLKQAVEGKKFMLFNLSKGKLGAEASEALGRLIIASIKGLALRRANTPVEDRIPIHLYIDECHNFIGPSIHTILTEARKYKLHLTMAQQVAGDGMSSDLKQIVFNNVQITFAGHTRRDSNLPGLLNVDINDLQRLALGQFYCRIAGGPAIKMQTHPLLTMDEYLMSDDDHVSLMQGQLVHYVPSDKQRADKAATQPVQTTASGSSDDYVPDLV